MIKQSNRLAQLFHPAPTVPRPIGPAVAKSKRRKPLGPVNAHGRARDALSGKHYDALARQLCPPADHRQQDRLYRQYRRVLLNEFSPTTFSQRTLIDSLAFDLLQLGRLGRMIEQLCQPARLPPRDETMLAGYRERRSLLPLAKFVLQAFDAGQDWTLPEPHARRLGRHRAQMLQVLADRLVEDQDPDLAPLTPEDILDRQPSEDMMAAAGPQWWRRFRDVETTVKVLTGKQPLEARNRNRNRFRAIMTYVRGGIEGWIKFHADDYQPALTHSRTATEKVLGTLARDPKALLALERGRMQLEKSKEGKLTQLRKFAALRGS